MWCNVTWFFRNHSKILIWNISYIENNCVHFSDSLINRKCKRTVFIWNRLFRNITNVFTVTLGQFNESLLNKLISLEKKNRYCPQTVVYIVYKKIYCNVHSGLYQFWMVSSLWRWKSHELEQARLCCGTKAPNKPTYSLHPLPTNLTRLLLVKQRLQKEYTVLFTHF